MKKLNKAASLLLACGFTAGIACMPVYASETTGQSVRNISFAENSIHSNAVSAPANRNQLGDLISESTKTYEQDGYTFVDTIRTYRYDGPTTFATEEKFFKEVSRTVSYGSEIYAKVTLDADFYCSVSDNTVRCPRYYSSYDYYIDMTTNPYETNKTESGGSIWWNGGIKYYKIECSYMYQIGLFGKPDYFNMSVGADAGGGDYECNN